MAKIRIDDGHGWRYNKGRLFYEGEQNIVFSHEYLGPALKAEGHEVSFTRGPDALEKEAAYGKARGLSSVNNQIHSLNHRGLGGKGHDLLISNHSNAGGGRGSHVWDDTGTPNKELALRIGRACAQGFGLAFGGVHYRKRGDGRNYYGVLLANAARSGILLERAFHDNLAESEILRSSHKQDQAAKAIAQAITGFYGAGIPIRAYPTVSIDQMKAFGKNKKAAGFFLDLAEDFYRISSAYGVDPAVTYAQAGKETAFGNYGGVLDASYHNPGAIKKKEGGGDKDPSAHERFPDWETGITAQVQHLALYAGRRVTKNIVDPRYFPWIRGRARTVAALSGNWAGPNYGQELEKLVRELQKTRF